MAVSGLIISFNEEKNIRNCIICLNKVCEEVIVIDSFSTDKTVEIAKKLGAKVYFQKFLGDGPQRIYGLQFCKNNWILNLDADERLDNDSFKFIKSGIYENNQYDAYNFKFRHFLGNEEINHSGWYPSYTCRFFNKVTASPSIAKVHQSIQAKKLKNTNCHIIHYGWNNFHQIISKYNLYTTWQSEEYYNKGKKINFFTPLYHGFWSFIRCYFLKKGLFNGLDGITFSLMQAFFSYIKYAKLKKLYNKNNK
ncbi:MAG: glycosyltransferase family 2 protein [Tenacibaculum sp.]